MAYICVCMCTLSVLAYHCMHITSSGIYIHRDVQTLPCLDSNGNTHTHACTHTHTYTHVHTYTYTYTHTHTHPHTHSFSTSSEGNTREANALLNIVENSYTIHRTMVTVISHICNDTPSDDHTLSNPPIPI